MAEQANIFDIQRFSIHDGPGIRTTIFFKGCPLRCCWCQNPESLKPNSEIAFYKERCARCFTCKDVCPEKAVLESEDVRIDYETCNMCEACTAACPRNALRLIGAYWNPEDLCTEIVKDKDFFDDSNGGITLSGGEPAMHINFLKAFLPRVKTEGLHVTMETCGMFEWHTFKDIVGYLNLIYFDLKCIDRVKHKRLTGADNRTILNNFNKLAETSPLLQARMPLIPALNDSTANIRETAKWLKRSGCKSIHVLPYHHYGEAKLARIKTDLKPLHLDLDLEKHTASARMRFESEGIEAIVYD